MNDNLLHAITATIEEKTNFRCGEVSPEDFQGYENLNLELAAKRLFQWRWFLEDAEVGPVIYSSSRILEREKENNYLEQGLIQIGDCPNGDEIYFRKSDWAVLYWSHDEVIDEEWTIKSDSSLYPAYSRIEYLLLNIVNQNFIPWDSYSAREYFYLYHGK